MKTLALILILISCSSNISAVNFPKDFSTESRDFPIPDNITLRKGKCNIGVNSKVELISIIQYISEYKKNFSFLMAPDTTSYTTDVINHFIKYTQHPVIKMFNRLSSKPGMLNFSAPSYIMFYLDTDLEVREDIIPDNFVLNRVGGLDSLHQFSVLLKDFTVQSQFQAFFNLHSDYYKKVAESGIAGLGQYDLPGEIEQFFGTSKSDYNVCLSSLYGRVGFGNWITKDNGEDEVFTVIGAQGIIDGISFFGNESYLKPFLRHEFCHPFINEMTEKHLGQITGYSDFFDSIPDKTKKGVCGDLKDCINEFTIRAITVYLAENDNHDHGVQIFNRELSKGVINLNDLLERIKLFQNERSTYPTFESFYPIFLEAFKN